MDFIKINGRILDEKEYEKEVFLIKKLVEYELAETLRKYGFEKQGNSYIHEELLIRCSLLFLTATKPL